MLCLTRRVGESIMVDGHEVKIIANEHGKVTLGVEAPKEIPVHRKEIWMRIQAEKEQGND